jgi:hypothetical protein
MEWGASGRRVVAGCAQPHLDKILHRSIEGGREGAPKGHVDYAPPSVARHVLLDPAQPGDDGGVGALPAVCHHLDWVDGGLPGDAVVGACMWARARVICGGGTPEGASACVGARGGAAEPSACACAWHGADP